MIRYVVAALSALTILSASAAHLVLDNGETRLIADDEQVFIVKENQRLWFLGKTDEEPPVEEPPVDDGPEKGSREWCEAFDTTQPYSFDTQDFDRLCDTNDDGKYNYCEDYVPFQNGFTFEDQDYVRECSS